MAQGSEKAVLYAIAGNAMVTLLKFGAAVITHSASMMNEAVHSLMDTTNQVFLLFGLKQGGRPADTKYAFGHGQKKYLWNLWSAIGLFSIGSGLGIAHAWHAYHNLDEIGRPETVTLLGVSLDPIWVSAVVLATALALEAYVLYVAGREFLMRMRVENVESPVRYLLEADDPTLVAVVLEDSIAVTGVVLAALGIGLSRLTGNPLWDIGFSVVIALMLGVVAFFLGAVNMRFLTNIRDLEAEQAFREIADSHREVERYHDLRSIIVDENHTIIVAEVELREEAMIPGLRGRIIDQEQQLIENIPEGKRGDDNVRAYINARAAVEATLWRTEKVVDELEAQLRERCPQISHITIEVEGIAAPAVLLDEATKVISNV